MAYLSCSSVSARPILPWPLGRQRHVMLSTESSCSRQSPDLIPRQRVHLDRADGRTRSARKQRRQYSGDMLAAPLLADSRSRARA